MSTRLVWLRRIVALVVLALVPLGSSTVAAHPASLPRLQATGTLTGQVLSADNVPLAGIRLAVYNAANTTPDRQPMLTTQTDATGRYSVAVPAGPVWLSVLTQDIGGQSFWGYDREPVNVVAGTTLPDQDFRVAIRVLPTPAPAVPTAAPAVPTPPVPATPLPATPVPSPAEPSPGMPASGQPGPSPGLTMLILGLLIIAGLALRRRATAG